MWTDALERLIDQADVFQLFWSSRSMYSDFCRREWEYALEKGVNIRPVYWERPMPAPPRELKSLHFAAFGGVVAAPTSNESAIATIETATTGDAGAPAPSAKLTRVGRMLLAPLSAVSALLIWFSLHLGASPQIVSEMDGGRTPAVASEVAPPGPAMAETPPPSPVAELDSPNERYRHPALLPPVLDGSSRGGGGRPASGARPCNCQPGDPLCDCLGSGGLAGIGTVGSGSGSTGTGAGGGLQRPPKHVCFMSAVSSGPLYPQLSGRLSRNPGCAVGKNLATFRPEDLPPQQKRNALESQCSRVILRQCAPLAAPDAQ